MPKATTGEEAVAAAAVVIAALGTTKKQSQEAGKAKRQQKAKEKRKKKADEEDAEEEDAETDACDDSEAPGTPDSELPTATRTMLTIHRPARRSQLATREQRRGTTRILTVVAKRQRSSEPVQRRAPSAPADWQTMVLVATGMARM